MAHRTSIRLRLIAEDRTALKAQQAFASERTATRAFGIAMHQYSDTPTALLNIIVERD